MTQEAVDGGCQEDTRTTLPGHLTDEAPSHRGSRMRLDWMLALDNRGLLCRVCILDAGCQPRHAADPFATDSAA